VSRSGAFFRRAGLALAVWACSLALYGLYFQGQWIYGERPVIHITGDEPHYLLIATSLLRDGDLDVLNNYRDKHYQPFYPYHLGDARQPEDMHALYGPSGGLYSKHGVGLPLLLLPAMRLGGTGEGHGLAIVFMLGVAAALSTQIFLLARETTGRAAVAIVAWSAVAFTSPLLLYAGQIYPEVPGALLVVWGVRAVWRASARAPSKEAGADGQAGAALRLGLAVALLPWLHLRYVPLAAVLAVAGVAACAPRIRQLWPLLVGPPVVAGSLLLALNWHLFGGLPAAGEYGTFAVQNVLTGTPGLFFDQQFGLLVYAPVYLIALFGLPLVPRRLPGLRGAVPLAVLGLYTLFVAAFSYWYGAYSPPSRMLVPVLPLLVAPLALALAEWRAVPFRLVSAALLLLSWSIARLLMDVPRLRYNLPTGRSEMLAYLSTTWGQDVTAYVPSFVLPTPAAYAWAVVATFLLWLLYLSLTSRARGGRASRAPRRRLTSASLEP
jgi:hypothetical protein